MAKPNPAKMNGQKWQNRIVGYDNVPPDQLLANPLNFRLHPKNQQDALVGSLNELGWLQDVIVNRVTQHVLDGHLRVQLALRNGESAIPVKYVELSEDEEKLALAIFDPITYMAEMDAEIFSALIADVNTSEAALQELLAALAEDAGIVPGEKASSVEGAEPQIDKAEELRQKWGVELGQLWQLGEHRLICGDCTDADVVARVMAGGFFDLVVTSPPYNSGDGGYKSDYSGQKQRFYIDDTDDRTEAEWVSFCEEILTLCSRHARDDGSVVFWNVMYTARCRAGYGQVLFGGRQPFTVKETICWDKGNGFPTASKGILSRDWELCFVLSKGDKYNTTQGENEPRWAKWEIPRPSKQGDIHRATFPLDLAARAITDFSFAESEVYEPFCGSGTTIIACEQLGRKCRAVELSPAYVAVALQRWADATGKTPIVVG